VSSGAVSSGAVSSSALRFWRRDPRPWWSWAGLIAVAMLALGLFTWSLSRNGMGNAYYAAAVKSASTSWKALFFGALDPGSFITVDKLPASLWIQGLSARLFGFSSWSILLPQALAGVASVLILYRLVRRWQGDVAGILAALAFALTPVAVVMFRLNNPDALLTLLLLAAAWALWSALEKGSTWILMGCGALVGFAFLTKMLEALVVLPAFALVYVVCARPRLGRRLLQVMAAAAALVVSSAWWVAIVELWPAAGRPFIGGSADNSVLDLVFSRSAGYLGSAGPVPNFSGAAGWLRIFNAELGGQISWLVPLALVGLGAGLWLTRRRGRTDLARAGYLLWGAWTLLYLGVFSWATGVLHPYYAVILAPSVAALAGAGSVAMWRLGRANRRLAWLLPGAVVGTAVLSAYLLGRTPGYAPGLATAVVVAGSLAAAGLFLVILRVVNAKTLTVGVAVVATACVLAGPTAYSLSTVSRSVTGALAAAGPASAAQLPGGMPGAGGLAALPGPPSAALGDLAAAGQPGAETAVDQSLVDYLVANRGSAEFLVAVAGAQAAQSIIIATGEPVMAMGGFSGADPCPTPAQLQEMSAAHRIRYVLVGGNRGPGGPIGPLAASETASPAAPAAGEPTSNYGPPAGASAGSVGGLPGGPGISGGPSASIEQWVRQNGTVVDATEYGGSSGSGTLYRLW